MANTYTWSFPTLQTHTHQDGLENVVYVVHWYYTGTSSPDTGSYSYQMYGAQQISPFVSGSRPFIPFDQLTEADVQEWVEESFGPERISEMQSAIDSQIQNQINPPIAYLSPPWNVPSPTPTASPQVDPTPAPTFYPNPEPTPTPSSI
jgi:hypothetical protein